MSRIVSTAQMAVITASMLNGDPENDLELIRMEIERFLEER